MAKQPEKYVLHVISNTHWDREWRHPFQRMRMDLVELMDRLLDICENEPDFKHYHLDSQTILLEDYLEIRPENSELLSKHIKNGKILVGPWYTLPDMFLVSGEAMVRNMLRGHQVAASLGGKAMKVGYTPTSYGQTSQIAQVYSGFGVDSIMFYRGIDAYGIKNSEYILEGVDGTRILGIKFGITMTRFNFRFNVFSATIHKDGGEPRIYFHPCDPDMVHDSYSFLHTEYDNTFNPKHIAAGIERAKNLIKDMATTEHLLMMDGFDASYPHKNTGRICAEAKKYGVTDTIIHQSFPKYVEAVKKSVDWNKLQVVKGERRTPATDTMGTSLMQGVLTSHSYFKRMNHDTQTLLEKYAEPVSSMAWMLGADYPLEALRLSWRYLLANHGHDTICGASVDQIYIDAMDRLRQSQMIALNTALNREREIVGTITSKKKGTDTSIITVFNSLPFNRTELVDAYIDFPREDKAKSFVIEDFNGKQIPYQIVSKVSEYGVAENGDVGYPAYYVDKYQIQFLATDVPGFGYKCFRVKANVAPAALKSKSLVASTNTMENAHVKVTINKNGTFDVTDKATRKTYAGLNYFEDGGDAGTPWYYIKPKKDKLFNTLKTKPTIKLVEDKPMAATYRIEMDLKVPSALTLDKTERVNQMKSINFVTFVRLTSDAKFVAVKTQIDTPTKDHRISVKFPTGIKTDVSYAEGSFDTLQRKIDWTGVDYSKWIDKEVGIQPQQSFVDLTDGKAGLAILNRGLRDYEVSQDKDRVVRLTLLRGIRYPLIAGGADPWVDTFRPKMCQCQGQYEFDYAVMPHAGDWQEGDLYTEARRFQAPMRVSQVSGGGTVSTLKPELSLMQIEPKQLVLSAMKLAESGKSLIVRLYNPTSKKVSGTVTFANELKRARLTNLNEEPQSEVKLKNSNAVALEVGPKKIITLEVFLKPIKVK